jgi:hypothetical protein
MSLQEQCAKLYRLDEERTALRAKIKAIEDKEEAQWQQIEMGAYEFAPEDEQILFYLNHELAQCKSKTNVCLQIIAQLHHKNKQKYKFVQGKPVKLMSIVFTNNSLLEGKAWKCRTAAKFNGGNVIVKRLASDVGKKSGDFTRGNDLLATLVTCAADIIDDGNKILGDILIMCNHPTRINDIIGLLNTWNGLKSKNGVTFKFNIFFDECDDGMCLSNMVNFVNNIYKKKLEHFIDEIQLITATPTEEMHKKLKNISSDATKLLNIKKRIPTQEVVRTKDYKTILDQKFIPFEGPTNPVEYVTSLNDNHPEIFTLGKIYFIPASHYCTEHDIMAKLQIFKDKGYWILVLNGKEKGFRCPLGQKSQLDLKRGELRDILRKWRADYPTAGLVITGNKVLERGLTFLTDGFCFDYIIVSSYFARKLTALVQMLGRGQGNIKYVGTLTLITPQSLYDSVNKYIEDSEKILKDEPDYYDSDMLAKIGKVDKFTNVEEPHFENTIEELNNWVKKNIRKLDGKPPTIQLHKWQEKPIDDKGFILHSWRGSGGKVWSEEEVLQQRTSGISTPYQKRIYPCYTDLNDVTSLRWYVLYRNA